jgi:hypothetical protein
MTYPVGPLPAAGQLNGLFVPYKSKAFTHGSSDLDLTDPTNGLAPGAHELYCLGTGNIVARLAGDGAEQTYPVVAGTVLKGAFVLLKSTSTADCIARQVT